jgi:hypothetical protein
MLKTRHFDGTLTMMAPNHAHDRHRDWSNTTISAGKT